TPIFDGLWSSYSHTQLEAGGTAVGLPAGPMGHSEGGHLNLGAGAVVKQGLTRIDDAVQDGSLADNAVLKAAMTGYEPGHLLGRVRHGGVASSERLLRALGRMGVAVRVPDLIVHTFTAGRGTSQTAGAGYVGEVETWGGGRVGSVVGRYWAMD